ncbi:peptidylprolyl isomerase [Basilea psittacipulmonis]|uniref:Chaperone SurA n=1 Tax=Basilea psittacipulmonis DSM 24701 TaxID=1072685 RepID=A0A077DHH4_9BURK|nr:peptidylprolyl isomerase [Basilea psittacipulmonis]AIL33007.1 hypothetical protein IX83_06485 [Basilea psittacipulmonis DSM 24701]
MMRSHIKKILLVSALLPTMAFSATPIDRVVAVVNSQIITETQLNQRLATLRINHSNLRQKEDVLNALINEQLLTQRADQYGIEVTPQQLSAALTDTAMRNNMNLDQLRVAVQREGLRWDDYIENFRTELRMQMLRQAIVQNEVVVDEVDVDGFLKEHPLGLLDHQIKPIDVTQPYFVPKAIHLQQIFLPLPEHPSPEQIKKISDTIQQIYKSLSQGVDFASLALRYSAAQNASAGGDLGLRLLEDWPQLFIDATQNVPDGGVSRPIEAPNGIHILRVVERRGVVKHRKQSISTQESELAKQLKSGKPIMMQRFETQLIRVVATPVLTPDLAKAKIQEAYKELQSGADFNTVARKYSDDNSAPLGGDVGWLTETDTSPVMLKALHETAIGTYSKPFIANNALYIVKVNAKDAQDITNIVRRNLARNNIYEERAQAALENFYAQIRAGAYIDNKLSK